METSAMLLLLKSLPLFERLTLESLFAFDTVL